MPNLVPMVLERTSQGERSYDLYSRLLKMTMYPHDEFWQCMDTYRDWELLNQMYKTGKAPWVR